LIFVPHSIEVPVFSQDSDVYVLDVYNFVSFYCFRTVLTVWFALFCSFFRDIVITYLIYIKILDTTFCVEACWWLATRRWFSPDNPGFHHQWNWLPRYNEILLKVALNTMTITLYRYHRFPLHPPQAHLNIILYSIKLSISMYGLFFL